MDGSWLVEARRPSDGLPVRLVLEGWEDDDPNSLGESVSLWLKHSDVVSVIEISWFDDGRKCMVLAYVDDSGRESA